MAGLATAGHVSVDDGGAFEEAAESIAEAARDRARVAELEKKECRAGIAAGELWNVERACRATAGAARELLVTDGDLVEAARALLAAARALFAAARTLLAAAGELLAAAGELVEAAGELLAADGEPLAAAGELLVAAEVAARWDPNTRNGFISRNIFILYFVDLRTLGLLCLRRMCGRTSSMARSYQN